MTYITTATTTPIGLGYGLLVEINKALTGTVTIQDGGTTVAIIAATTGVTSKRYYGFKGAISIITASAEDITASILNHQAT